MSYCQNKGVSCSACCGVYNLDFDESERLAWITQNTREFLATDIAKAENIVAYRSHGEERTDPHRIHKETYACPFVGWMDESQTRSGCLLHPQGSPHKQIGLWERPQNFSFYGEGICLSYDCPTKENDLLDRQTKGSAYAQVVANHNLIRCLDRLTGQPEIDIEKLWQLVQRRLARHPVPVTSFQLPMSRPHSKDQWHILGSLLDPQAYHHDRIEVTARGFRRGRALQRIVAA